MLFHYGNCKNELYDLNRLKLSLEKKIHELEVHNAALLGQVEEGKAMFHYQVAELERKIRNLEAEVASRKCVMETNDQQINVLIQDNGKLSQEHAKVSKEAKYWADLYADLTSKPLHPMNEACRKDTDIKTLERELQIERSCNKRLEEAVAHCNTNHEDQQEAELIVSESKYPKKKVKKK